MLWTWLLVIVLSVLGGSALIALRIGALAETQLRRERVARWEVSRALASGADPEAPRLRLLRGDEVA